jgi:hypothetical protein
MLQRMFYWTQPFSDGVWLLLAGSISAAAMAMPFFERGTGGTGDDFAGGDLHSRGELAGHALFLASMAPANFATFNPSTASGRVAAALQAFSLLLVMCSYTANLAAQLTTTQPPFQAVSDVSSFGAALPLCMRSSSTAETLLNSSWPAVAATVLDANVFSVSTYGTRDAIDAVLAGTCAGALVPATEAAWVMNANDTRGALCAAVPVSAPVGEEGVPLTFAVPGLHAGALTAAQLEAVDVAISEMHRDGAFLLALRAQFFPDPPRAPCAAADAVDDAAYLSLSPAAQLEPIDLAGAFLLQGLGILLGVCFHVSKGARRRWIPTSKPMETGDADGEEEGGAAEQAQQQQKVQWLEQAPEQAQAAAPPPLPPALRMPPQAQQQPAASAREALPPPGRGPLPLWDLDAGAAAAQGASSRAGSGVGVGAQQRAPRRDGRPLPPPPVPAPHEGSQCWPLV